MTIQTLLDTWLSLPDKGFSRDAQVNSYGIHCDCSGLINLLFNHMGMTKPYALEHPKAVHYYAMLQEVGSSHISQVKPWNLMAWRKDNVPKSGDTGHVLLVAGVPLKTAEQVYHLDVIDATKVSNGLARRKIELHTNEHGTVIGVRLHLSETKVKRSPIYHAPLLNNRYCLGCGIPHKLCLCGQVEASKVQATTIIFRHPDERKKTLSTVSLIKQRYPSILVKEGEQFAPLRGRNLALLFPDTDIGTDKIDNADSVDFHPPDMTLILLDATWRKAKRMLHENSWLSDLPRVSIKPQNVSDYLLRKVPSVESLSTVEAFALVQKDLSLQPLFRRFMEKQIALMGKATYEKNYSHFLNYKQY